MASIQDIGSRVELLSMDGHFHDITVALYRQSGRDGAPVYRVHTYSSRDGAGARVAQIALAMRAMGGLEADAGAPPRLRFPCGDAHEVAVRRLFLEACKVDAEAPATARPLSTQDRKSGLAIAVDSLGEGQYRIRAAGGADADAKAQRLGVIANGLMKLGGMRTLAHPRGEVVADCVGFDCGHAHDELVGLLLARAPNVRAIVREQEAMAARGLLAAPSQQGR